MISFSDGFLTMTDTELLILLWSYKGDRRVVDNILACGAGKPEFVPHIPARLTSPSLTRLWRFLNETYNVMWCPACLPCN